MIAMTTRSSIRVNPVRGSRRTDMFHLVLRESEPFNEDSHDADTDMWNAVSFLRLMPESPLKF